MKQNGITNVLNGNGRHFTDTNGTHYAKIESLLKANEPGPNDETKIRLISEHFRQIMTLLGLDLSDDSLSGTPDRVARMYVNEIFSGLKPENAPDVTLFENSYRYSEMLIEKNITVYSCCEHHLVPIIGKAHVAYYSSGKVIGLSKINRIVQYYCKRPQVQERLTEQIAQAMKTAIQTDDVAVVIDAAHLCVASRGICDFNSTTLTSHYSGKFQIEAIRKEFLSHVK
jgi:GTP cyclohydrolase IA